MRLMFLVFCVTTLAGCANSQPKDAVSEKIDLPAPTEETLAHSHGSQQSQCSSNRISLAAVDSKKQLERSGCCSWHGGVCGCSNGRAVCCDGNYSPTCRC